MPGRCNRCGAAQRARRATGGRFGKRKEDIVRVKQILVQTTHFCVDNNDHGPTTFMPVPNSRRCTRAGGPSTREGMQSTTWEQGDTHPSVYVAPGFWPIASVVGKSTICKLLGQVQTTVTERAGGGLVTLTTGNDMGSPVGVGLGEGTGTGLRRRDVTPAFTI